MTNSIKVDLGDRIVDLILRSVQLPSNAQLSDAITREFANEPERVFTRDEFGMWIVDSDGVIKSAGN